MKSRLNRLEMLFEENPVYFVTANLQGRRRLLDNEPAHRVFCEFCKAARERGVLVGRYVLMPDHLHLFVCIPPRAGVGLSSWVKSLKNSLSKHWRESGVSAPHWQKGFFDHLLRSGESETEKWRYVYQNPVRAGLCNHGSEWPFSGEICPSTQG